MVGLAGLRVWGGGALGIVELGHRCRNCGPAAFLDSTCMEFSTMFWVVYKTLLYIPACNRF